MQSNVLVSSLRWMILVILVSSFKVTGKPTLNSGKPVDKVAISDPTQLICTPESIDLCQHCAKTTESPIVYPQCCANHEGVRVWCKQYLNFGLL